MDQVPLFDFHTPWIAIVQLALMFVLPTLVGLVTDRLSASTLKVALLGGLTLVATLLTAWLDSALSGTAYDWINVLFNGVVTWGLAIAAHLGILKPAGLTDAVQKSNVIQVFNPSPDRVVEHLNGKAA